MFAVRSHRLDVAWSSWHVGFSLTCEVCNYSRVWVLSLIYKLKHCSRQQQSFAASAQKTCHLWKLELIFKTTEKRKEKLKHIQKIVTNYLKIVFGVHHISEESFLCVISKCINSKVLMIFMTYCFKTIVNYGKLLVLYSQTFLLSYRERKATVFIVYSI